MSHVLKVFLAHVEFKVHIAGCLEGLRAICQPWNNISWKKCWLQADSMSGHKVHRLFHSLLVQLLELHNGLSMASEIPLGHGNWQCFAVLWECTGSVGIPSLFRLDRYTSCDTSQSASHAPHSIESPTAKQLRLCNSLVQGPISAQCLVNRLMMLVQFSADFSARILALFQYKMIMRPSYVNYVFVRKTW